MSTSSAFSTFCLPFHKYLYFLIRLRNLHNDLIQRCINKNKRGNHF
nr:MAG TPA: hypothetical protein [Caudoviricetes sp.]